MGRTCRIGPETVCGLFIFSSDSFLLVQGGGYRNPPKVRCARPSQRWPSRSLVCFCSNEAGQSVLCPGGMRSVGVLGSDPSISLPLCSAQLIKLLWQWDSVHQTLGTESGPLKKKNPSLTVLVFLRFACLSFRHGEIKEEERWCGGRER